MMVELYYRSAKGAIVLCAFCFPVQGVLQWAPVPSTRETRRMSEQPSPGRSTWSGPAFAADPCESLAAFDDHARTWETYTHTPLGQLREALTRHCLAQHLAAPPPRLTLLDAGGGTGGYALPLARQGHEVCLLDFSSEMLLTARRKAEQLGPPLRDNLSFCQAPVIQVPDLFGPDHFDWVLCHTLLEYVSEPWEVLRGLLAVLKPGGVLSLLAVNPHSAPLRWAIAGQDLEKARLALREEVPSADLFGLPRRPLRPDAVQEALSRLGIETVAQYGVRIFADHMPADRLADPGFRTQLMALEIATSALAPYRQIARYILTVGKKRER
jgi:S-adenosylmethionine-dependent methyltransferase